jgi:hypothetical protein
MPITTGPYVAQHKDISLNGKHNGMGIDRRHPFDAVQIQIVFQSESPENLSNSRAGTTLQNI